MPQGKRYKFQGSTFAVQTGLGATDTITAITAANPPVVTATAHGNLEGDVGQIAGVVGMTELNGNLYVVDDPAANTFELADVDATAYTPYTSGGTFAPVVFSSFCELTGVNQQDGQADEIEVSTSARRPRSSRSAWATAARCSSTSTGPATRPCRRRCVRPSVLAPSRPSA
jgi:hypothetical protein